MGRRMIFAVNSPLGYRVSLSRDRWREIIRYKHPAMAGSEGAVRECLKAPKLIRESAKDATVHLYYAPAGQVHLCVVVAPENKTEWFVVTAYFTRNIKEGKDLWTS
jgi:hypothetical protein